MRAYFIAIALAGVAAAPVFAAPPKAPIDTAKIEELTGAKGAFNEKNGMVYTPQDIRFTANDNILYATVLAWPGEAASIKSLVPKGNTWTGLYPSEIASIAMLGDGAELPWKFTPDALVIQTPKNKPCDHAYVFKITRKKPF